MICNGEPSVNMEEREDVCVEKNQEVSGVESEEVIAVVSKKYYCGNE